MEETQIDVMTLNAGLLTINEIRVERGLETVPWGDTPFMMQTHDYNTDTTDASIDNAFQLIQNAKTELWRTYEY